MFWKIHRERLLKFFLIDRRIPIEDAIGIVVELERIKTIKLAADQAVLVESEENAEDCGHGERVRNEDKRKEDCMRISKISRNEYYVNIILEGETRTSEFI